MATGSQIDPIAAIAALLAPIVGAAAASAWVPHLAVLFFGMAGGVLGLMSWRQCTRLQALVYVLCMGVAGWMFTSFAVWLAARAWAPIESAPQAHIVGSMCIGWVGHRWEGVGRALLTRAKQLAAPEKKVRR